ncbi:DUF1566 domain-containing protein [Ampullimonas aquatilis]|uniref:Lcl C-terminal domain-containing protein n=1 Tax=Ampullimonas aquatilis TaxID=1341549 RepID=UPI003C721A96
MKLSKLCFSLLLVFLSLIPHSAFATLVTRLNGQAVYDTDINLTWLANANLSATNTFGVSGIDPHGYMHWNTAQQWIAAMNKANYLGFNDWRLPNSSDACFEVYSGCEKNEMAHLRNSELSTPYFPFDVTNIGPFINVQATYIPGSPFVPTYWTNISVSNNQEDAYFYYMSWDNQSQSGKNYYWSSAWAVRAGDVAAVPIPAPVGLMVSGIVMLGLASKKRVSEN